MKIRIVLHVVSVLDLLKMGERAQMGALEVGLLLQDRSSASSVTPLDLY